MSKHKAIFDRVEGDLHRDRLTNRRFVMSFLGLLVAAAFVGTLIIGGFSLFQSIRSYQEAISFHSVP